jgi:hypothetical protein
MQWLRNGSPFLCERIANGEIPISQERIGVIIRADRVTVARYKAAATSADNRNLPQSDHRARPNVSVCVGPPSSSMRVPSKWQFLLNLRRKRGLLRLQAQGRLRQNKCL